MVMSNCTNQKKRIIIVLHVGYFVASHEVMYPNDIFFLGFLVGVSNYQVMNLFVLRVHNFLFTFDWKNLKNLWYLEIKYQWCIKLPNQCWFHPFVRQFNAWDWCVLLPLKNLPSRASWPSILSTTLKNYNEKLCWKKNAPKWWSHRARKLPKIQETCKTKSNKRGENNHDK